MNGSKEFQVNDYITLRLVRDETVIFVAGEHFMQCKKLLIDIPVGDMENFDDIESIDEVADMLKWNVELGRQEGVEYDLSPETEFFGHCSNLRGWWEHNYNTNLIHRNLAFPLLKKLTEVGDPVAKRVFKEEITKRFESGSPNVIKYLLIQGYLEYIKTEINIENLFLNERFLESLKKASSPAELNSILPILEKLSYVNPVTKQLFKEEIAKRFESGSPNVIEYLLIQGYLEYIKTEINIEDLFLNGRFFKSLKNGYPEQIIEIFKYLHLDIITISSFLITCSSKILGDVLECLLLLCKYQPGDITIFQLIEIMNESLNDPRFFRNFINFGKLILENEKKPYPLIYNDYFRFRDNGGFFYEILNLVCLKDFEKWSRYEKSLLIGSSDKIPTISYSPNVKDNIVKLLEKGDTEDIDVIVRMRFLEYFDSTELENLLKKPRLGLINKLNKSDYWLSNANIPIWYIYDYYENVYEHEYRYKPHGNLAYPIYKKLSQSGSLWAKDMMLEEIENVFKNNDITGILYVVQELYLDTKIFDEYIGNLISKLSLDTCRLIIKKLSILHDLLSWQPEFKEKKIIHKLLTIKEFKETAVKLYNIDSISEDEIGQLDLSYINYIDYLDDIRKK